MVNQSYNFIGEVIGLGKLVNCSNCNCSLRDDHGFVINNQFFCKDQYKCNLRKAELKRNKSSKWKIK